MGNPARELETRGFMRLIMDAASEEFLGAAILGLHGDEAVQPLFDVTAKHRATWRLPPV